MSVREQIKTVLEKNGVSLRFNTFTDHIMVTTIDGQERIMDELARGDIAMMIHDSKIKPSALVSDAALLSIAHETKFHPVLSYLNSLTWDGKPRVGTWLVDYFGAANTVFEREVGKLFLIAAVRRVRRPGCKFDECLVLTGPEGIGKSSAVQILAGEWFADNLPLGADAKETVEQTQGVWISESAELVGNSPTKVDKIKRFLGSIKDGPYRAAYARLPSEKLRQFVPVATTNEATFLFSNTGDRRFWPVDCRMADVRKLRLNRDQLWAEAATLEAQGASIRLDAKHWDMARAVQRRYGVEDPWETRLTTMINSGAKMTLAAIWSHFNIPIEKQTAADAKRIATIMGKLGYKKERQTTEAGRTTVYARPNIMDSDNFDINPDTAEEDNDPEGAMTSADYEKMKAIEAELGDYDVEDYQ